MRILWNNEIDKYTLLYNSEQSAYPIENVQDYQLAKKYRTSDITDEWVEIDAGAGKTITPTSAGILNHNLTSGGTYKIQGNANDVWTDPTVNETFVYNADMMLKYFTGSALRFWRYHFVDGSNPDGYLQIGRLFLGAYLQTDTAGKDISILYEDNSKVDESPSGQDFGDERIIRRIYDFVFPYWNDTVRKSFVTMIMEIKKIKPIILVPDENNITKIVPVYCRLNDNMNINHIVSYKWNGALNFKEVF